MLIDAAALTKFGNMTSGFGLPALFDGLNTTTGYAQATAGYAGVVLPAGRRIKCVEVSSPSNGFDASGSLTSITLQLYGKNGSQPASSTDGALLGSMSFQDQNTERAISIPSSDSLTPYQFVWVRINTGIWAVASEIKFYEDVSEIQEMQPIGQGTRSIAKSCNWGVPLTYYSQEIPEFKIRFRLSERRLVKIYFHADVIHVGENDEVNYVSGFSFRICRRYSDDIATLSTSPLITIDNAVSGGNVSERNPQHYGNTSIQTPATPSIDPEECGFLEPGYHEITVLGSGHSLLTSTNLLKILAENGKGLNALMVTISPQ